MKYNFHIVHWTTHLQLWTRIKFHIIQTVISVLSCLLLLSPCNIIKMRHISTRTSSTVHTAIPGRILWSSLCVEAWTSTKFYLVAETKYTIPSRSGLCLIAGHEIPRSNQCVYHKWHCDIRHEVHTNCSVPFDLGAYRPWDSKMSSNLIADLWPESIALRVDSWLPLFYLPNSNNFIMMAAP